MFKERLEFFDQVKHKIDWSQNIPLQILNHYPNLLWDYEKLSFNKHVTWKFIQEHEDKPWEWNEIVCKKINLKDLNEEQIQQFQIQCTHITLDMIQHNPDFPWNWTLLSQNYFISEDIILAFSEKDWNWATLSSRNLSYEVYQLNKPWNYILLSQNPYIPLEFIKNNMDKPWNFIQLSYNNNIDIEFVKANLDKSWSWCGLSSRVIFDESSFDITLPWVWNNLSYNPHLTWSIICKYPHKPWLYHAISRYSIRNINHVKQNLHLPWDWQMLSLNPNITWDMIEQNMDLPWNFMQISSRYDIPWEIIQKYPDLNWSWYFVSQKVNWKIVKENPNLPWIWEMFSEGDFWEIKKTDLMDYFKKHVAATKIQRTWKKVIADPHFLICRKRLLKEWKTMLS